MNIGAMPASAKQDAVLLLAGLKQNRPDEAAAILKAGNARVETFGGSSPSLAADRDILDDDRAQPLGTRIDVRGNPGGAATHDQHIELLAGRQVAIEAKEPGDLGGRGIGDDGIASEDDGGLIVSIVQTPSE